ncbi:MAG: rod-binding protein [Desulfovibrionaceae bacterium]
MNIHSLENMSATLEKNKTEALRSLHLKKANTKEGLRNASEDFEAFFLQKVLEVMSSGIGKHDMLFSQEEKIWQSMLHEEYAKLFSKAGGIGIADTIYTQLEPKITSTEE